MNLKVFILSVGIMVAFPYSIVTTSPENIAEARLIENAPRHTVTVKSKWTVPINPTVDGYWIKFQEPVAKTPEVQITSAEWKSIQPGGRITIAVLPDGRPHTLHSGANVAFEQFMFVMGLVLWFAATAYVIVVIRRWLRRRSHSDDPGGVSGGG